MPANGKMIRISATDEFETQAYLSMPDTGVTVGDISAGLICIMEAFGVNEHIQKVADDYAGQGYAVLAPALYDRLAREQVFDYHSQRGEAVDMMNRNGFENPVHDVAGCINYFKSVGIGKIGIVGYCYGGAVSWMAASRLPDIAAASCYYGSAIMGFFQEHPQCPTIAHWGRADPTTPAEQVAAIAALNPDVSMYWYGANHGFNSEDRAVTFDAAAARLARERSLALFKKYLR